MLTSKLKKIGRSLIVFVLVFAVASLLSPSNALATAIARDAHASFSATGLGGSGAATQSYTNNGTLLVFNIRNNTDSGDFITSVTYAGVAMTLGQKSTSGAFVGAPAYFYYILNPTTGANNLTVNYSGALQAQNYVGVVASYSGVGSIDASLYTTDTSCASNTHSVTPTKVNEWVITSEINVDGPPVAGTGANLVGTGNGSGVFDSNGTVTANSAYSMTITVSGGTRIGMWSMISVSPPVAATVSPWQFQDF